MDTATLIYKAKEFISKNIPQGTEFVARKNLTELMVGFYNKIKLEKPKLRPIERTYFKNMEELNEWFGSGEYCEILSITYDYNQLVTTVFYRLK
jgi:hypothetical protein